MSKTQIVEHFSRTPENAEHGQAIAAGLLSTMRLSEFPSGVMDRVSNDQDIETHASVLVYDLLKRFKGDALSKSVETWMGVKGLRLGLVPEYFDVGENDKRIAALESKVKRQEKALKLAKTRIDAVLED
jgi:hypothetical protein